VVAKVRERLAVRKQAAQKFDGERFNLRKLNDLEVWKQYQIDIYLDVFHPVVLYKYFNKLYTKLSSNTTIYLRCYLLWRHVLAPFQ
jgi:hypothetical protein